MPTPAVCRIRNRPCSSFFETFYQNSGFYTLSPLDGGFALTPKQGLRLQLKIAFTQQDGSDYFTISDITERAPEPSENVTVRWVMSADSEAQTASPDSADALQMSGLLIGAAYTDRRGGGGLSVLHRRGRRDV